MENKISLKLVAMENYGECLDLKREIKNFVGDSRDVLSNAYIYRESSSAYAICRGDVVIGLVILSEEPFKGRYEFTDFFIADDYQNKGYGREAVYEIIKKYKDMGKADKIQMQVNKTNYFAIKLYKKAGFKITGTSIHDEEFYLMEMLI